MKFIFRIILNGIKYTGLIFLFLCFIVLSFTISYHLLLWYLGLWQTVDSSNHYLLLIIPLIIFIGIFTTYTHSFLKNMFCLNDDNSEPNLDKLVEEIKVDLIKKNLI